ncbi:MAG: hypothetical protein M3Z87_02920 [Lactobacillus sp.]|nr:hypothetical protein [Lactobacillus sp.]
MAVGTALCRVTGLGIDPFNALCIGVANLLHKSSAFTTFVFQIIIFIVVTLRNRKLVGVGTIIPIVEFGYLLEKISLCFQQIAKISWQLKIIIFLIGLIVTALGMAIYMTCDLGMVPYDAISFLISNKRPFAARVINDALVAVIAYLIGGPISIGTILFAFATGPLISWFREKFVERAILEFIK